MTDVDLSQIGSIEPGEFSRLVKSTPDRRLAEVMAGEQRKGILDQIFGRFPQQFRSDRAGSTNAVIHWVIGGRSDGGSDTYQITIADGTCTTSATADADPRLTISAGAVEFLKLVSGAGNPMMMFMTGKIKAKGDLGLAANMGNLFGQPKG